MSVSTVVGIVLALISTTLVNIAYLREHDAAAAMPSLSPRHPAASVRALLANRAWLVAFGMEASGFLCYAGAVALASLALVQSIGAGGIGVLAFISARVSGRKLSRRRLTGVGLSVVGLLALGVSLTRSSGSGGHGDTAAILAWILVTVALAATVVLVGRTGGRVATAEGVAGGLLFSVGDLSTKIVTQGGARVGFLVTLVIGYALGTSLLQLGYQRGGTLTVAGIATLLTNAVPIIAGTVLLDEGIPSGAFGVLRVLSFCAVVAGAILLASPDRPAVCAPDAAEAPSGSQAAAA